MKKNDIFISYRRVGGDMAAMYIYQALKERGYSVFYDVEVLRAGKFNEELLKQIQGCRDVIVVLSPHALDRCVEDGDWVRMEIAEAIRCEKNIIPVMMNGFTFPEFLPTDINAIRFHSGLTSTTEYFQESMDRLCDKFLKSRPQKKNWMIPAAMGLACVAAVAGILLFRSVIPAPAPEPSPAGLPVAAEESVEKHEKRLAADEGHAALEESGYDAAHIIRFSVPVFPEAMEEISIMSDEWLFTMPYEGTWTLQYVDGVDLEAYIQDNQFNIKRFPRQEGITEYKATRYETDYQILLDAVKPKNYPEEALLLSAEGEDLNEKHIQVKVGKKISVTCHFVPENWSFLGQEQKATIWMHKGDADVLESECEGTSGTLRITQPGEYTVGVMVKSGAAVAYRFLHVNVTE